MLKANKSSKLNELKFVGHNYSKRSPKSKGAKLSRVRVGADGTPFCADTKMTATKMTKTAKMSLEKVKKF